MNVKVKRTLVWIVRVALILGTIALFRWIRHASGLVGFAIGCFSTAFVMIWILSRKNDTVRALTSLLEDKFKEEQGLKPAKPAKKKERGGKK